MPGSVAGVGRWMVRVFEGGVGVWFYRSGELAGGDAGIRKQMARVFEGRGFAGAERCREGAGIGRWSTGV